MLFADGAFGGRVSYLILLYTMGAVACARIVIEQDRNYALGYSAALGGAMFFVSFGFLGSPLFLIGFIAMIAYLADRIVHDCTLIDYSVDASGEGLIDRSLNEWQLLKNGGSAEGTRSIDDRPQSEQQRRRKKSHQPGRTVFLLAFAALPLFGLGQFVLQDQPRAWSTAQLLLAVYLFSSLSLLVTTSFLNLRRYLRQRDVEMPSDVTVGWLAGGIGLIAALMLMAYLIPMPGTVIARLSLPSFLTADTMLASRFGWGDEAADRSGDEGDAKTDALQQEQGKDQQGASDNPNAPTQSGGQQASQSDDADKGDNDASKQTSSGQSKSGPDNSGSSSNQKQNDSGKPSKDAKSTSKESSSKPEESNASEPSESNPGEQGRSEQSTPSEQGRNQADNQNDPAKQDQNSSDENSEAPPSESNSDDARSEEQSENGSQSKEKIEFDEKSAQSTPDSPNGGSNPLSGIASFLGSLLRFLLIAGLIAIVAVFVYRIRNQILDFFRSLFQRDLPETVAAESKTITKPVTPPRLFSSFDNPCVPGADPKRVVVVTFQAFEAWTRERGYVRRQDETPAEFIARLRQLGRHDAEARELLGTAENSAVRLGSTYDRVAYGRGTASRQDIQAAASLWKRMLRRDAVLR